MRKVLALVLVLVASAAFAKVKPPKAVVDRVNSLLRGEAKIVGVEKAPFEGFYVVFVESKKNKRPGILTISADGKYIILGRILDVSTPVPRDVIAEIAKRGGYIKPPKPQKVDMSKIDLKGTPRIGKEGTPYIVLYFDPTCPFCKKELKDLRELTKEGKLSFYPKYFIVHGEGARKKAVEAECIREAYGNQAYFDYVIEGRKPKKEPKCDRKAIRERIARDEKEAVKLGIRGTPTWVYQGKMYVGYKGKEEIKRIIDKGKNAKVK